MVKSIRKQKKLLKLRTSVVMISCLGFMALIFLFANIYIVYHSNILEGNQILLQPHRYDHTKISEGPAVALLMSFPNSGTTYTMMTVQQISNRTVATNYPHEAESYDPIVKRLYRSYSVPVILRRNLELPSKYILTKTHCSGYYFETNPANKLNSFNKFESGCFSWNNRKGTVYPNHLAKKVIHIIRDPVDNIISNFNLFKSRDVIHSKEEWDKISKIIGSDNIFKKYCQKYDEKWHKKTAKLFQENAFLLIKDVPCGSQYVIYSLWHNHAYQLAVNTLKIPTLSIHYSDYEEDFNGTIDKITRFLEIESVNTPNPFISGKKYSTYFTPQEREAIFKIIKHFTSPEVWELVKRYEHIPSNTTMP